MTLIIHQKQEMNNRTAIPEAPIHEIEALVAFAPCTGYTTVEAVLAYVNAYMEGRYRYWALANEEWYMAIAKTAATARLQ